MLVPAPTPGQPQTKKHLSVRSREGSSDCLFGTSCFELSRDIQTGGVWDNKTVQGEIGEHGQPLLSFDCHDLKCPPPPLA
jgi:hypothetical protein